MARFAVSFISLPHFFRFFFDSVPNFRALQRIKRWPSWIIINYGVTSCRMVSWFFRLLIRKNKDSMHILLSYNLKDQNHRILSSMCGCDRSSFAQRIGVRKFCGAGIGGWGEMQTAKVIRGKLQAAAVRRSPKLQLRLQQSDSARQSSKAARSLILYLRASDPGSCCTPKRSAF